MGEHTPARVAQETPSCGERRQQLRTLRTAGPGQSLLRPLPTPGGGTHRGRSRPIGGGGVLAGSAHARPNRTGNRGQPPLPPPCLPPPPPTTTRPPWSLTQGHIDFVQVLIASCFRWRRRGRRGSYQPGAKPVHDWGCGVGAVSREGQSRRPAASHSRTQTSCSAERARAPAASSPSHLPAAGGGEGLPRRAAGG